MDHEQLIRLTADVAAAHVANNRVATGEVGDLIVRVYGALSGLGAEAAPPAADEAKTPAVPVRSSVKPDCLICLECGRKQKTLKRHLAAAHGLSPDRYRSDYGLSDSYPMVAPEYASRRREMAVKIGLGQKGRARGKAAAPRTGGRRGKR
jgi:predicted transcriptional regulator